MAIPFSQFLSFLLPTRPPPPKSSIFPALPNHTPSSSPISLSVGQNQKQKQQLANKDAGGFEGCSSSSAELTAVMFPSLAHANTLYFQSAYNVQVVVEDNEPEERLINRFRREVMRAGVIQEVKRRRFFENKQDEKKRRTRDAAKRNSRRRRGPFQPRTGPSQFRQDSANASSAAKAEDDEDNWEMPDENIPF